MALVSGPSDGGRSDIFQPVFLRHVHVRIDSYIQAMALEPIMSGNRPPLVRVGASM
jgi:hypothetical protein